MRKVCRPKVGGSERKIPYRVEVKAILDKKIKKVRKNARDKKKNEASVKKEGKREK